ncbi:MAPEG family protein, partial [Mesorhizobium sp. M7D.F.Ca.US.004.03.1.1]
MTGFISWALGLLIVMEVIRMYLVISGKVAANGFTPDNAALSPFMQRLA